MTSSTDTYIDAVQFHFLIFCFEILQELASSYLTQEYTSNIVRLVTCEYSPIVQWFNAFLFLPLAEFRGVTKLKEGWSKFY